MAKPEATSLKQAAVQQAKSECRAWLVALIIIIAYWGAKAWLG